METNREVTWNTSTIQAFAFQQKCLISVFFLQYHYSSPVNEMSLDSQQLTTGVSKIQMRKHMKTVLRAWSSGNIAIKVFFCSFLNQKLVLPLRRKHCKISSLTFSLPQFTGDHSRPKAPTGCFSCFDSELEQPHSHHCDSKFPKESQR